MKNKSYIVVSDGMQRRRYRVRAYVDRKTGKVLVIKAGCRTWRTFAEAMAHYVGGGAYQCTYWKERRHVVGDGGAISDLVHNRNDAMLTLARVAAKVHMRQRRY